MEGYIIILMLGAVAWLANFVIARIKNWQILQVLNLACLMPIGGILVLEALFGTTGFFGALVLLMSLGIVIILMLSAVVAIAVTAFVESRAKHEVRS